MPVAVNKPLYAKPFFRETLKREEIQVRARAMSALKLLFWGRGGGAFGCVAVVAAARAAQRPGMALCHR